MYNNRIRALFCATVLAFFAVEARLFYLQVVRGEHYRDYADRQRVGLLPSNAARARILTSDGVVLAEDRLAFDVSVVIGKLDPPRERRLRDPLRRLFYVTKDERLLRVVGTDFSVCRTQLDDGGVRVTVEAWSKLEVEVPDSRGDLALHDVERDSGEFTLPGPLVDSVDRLARMTGEDGDELLKRVLGIALDVARLRTPVSAAVRVVEDVDYDAVVSVVETRPEEFRGFEITTRYERSAPAGPLAPHLVGYVGTFNEDDVKAAMEKYQGWPGRAYFINQRIGKAGVEKSMDDLLRDEFGLRCIERDNMGRLQEVLADAPPQPGRDVVLTIDSRLQKLLKDAMSGSVGAGVFIDVKTGEVLAIASSPAYDPDRFRRDYAELAADPEAPLFDRAVDARLPLGSVFKIVTALAAVEKNCVPPVVDCTGSVEYGGRTFRCNSRWGHGPMDLRGAIKHSCNVFFYRTAMRAGDEALIAMAHRLGLGRATGIRMPHESPGNVPLTARGGALLNLAIGQGDLTVTPLQVARMVAAAANGGVLVTPGIVRELRPFGGAGPAAEMLADDREPVPLGLPQEGLDAVRAGLYKAVNESGGTGARAFDGFERAFAVCGKTSTAQRKGVRDGGVVSDNVGWFAGYAPHDNPRVAFAIAVEHLGPGEGGGSRAAPVARKVFDSIPLELLGLGPAGQGGGR